MECDLCGKETNKLTPMATKRTEAMICDDCVGKYEVYADMEFERQKEEGIL